MKVSVRLALVGDLCTRNDSFRKFWRPFSWIDNIKEIGLWFSRNFIGAIERKINKSCLYWK